MPDHGPDGTLPVVTLLFAMKWFNSDLTNKGLRSELVKGLIIEQALKSQKDESGIGNPLIEDEKGNELVKVTPNKVKSENELLAYCYLIYLETNNYLTTDQKYLFGDLVQSTSKPIY